MSLLQKRIVAAGLCLFVLAGLFPRFIESRTDSFGFLFAPPEHAIRVDYATLFITWIMVAVATAVGAWLAKPQR